MFSADEYYSEEKQCTYKNETYLVRNNGAVLRCPKNANKIRPLDNKWTFGNLGDKGYLYIAGVQVHRIVATAFYGDAPSTQHIVDHKDTNRQNNRPENLHWVTKLENALNNPITRKRIITICGSIEAFLENPSLLGESQLDTNFSWMRRVTPEEAKICREKLEEWAKRASVDIIAQNEGSDPGAVVFDALQAAKSRNADVLICDTAGRLHNKKNLMDELRKIDKIITREFPDAYRENLIVLDGTTGQNALSQLKEFKDVCDVSGIILTKMDGTAKGGIAVAIQSEYNIPVKYIGVGEQIEDLQKFDSDEFVNALFETKEDISDDE